MSIFSTVKGENVDLLDIFVLLVIERLLICCMIEFGCMLDDCGRHWKAIKSILLDVGKAIKYFCMSCKLTYVFSKIVQVHITSLLPLCCRNL